MCRKGLKTQKMCLKVRLKEVIFYSFAFKSQKFAQVVEHFAQTCVCMSAVFRNSVIVVVLVHVSTHVDIYDHACKHM